MYVFRPQPTFQKFDLLSSLAKSIHLIMTSQEIFARLQEADGDNKKLWALSQEFESLYRKLSKAQDKVKEASESSLDLEDKEGLRKAVLEHLFTESERGNAQASDKLAKLAGLGEEKQDIIIEVVQYKKTPKVSRKGASNGKRNGAKKGVQSKKVRKGVRSNKVEQK